MIKWVLLTISYGALYYTLESFFNALFTKPHNKKINEVLKAKENDVNQGVHVIETVGFARLIMVPFAMIIGFLSYLPFLFSLNLIWWSNIVIIISHGVLFTISEMLFGMFIYKFTGARLWDYRKEHFKITEFTTLKHYGLWNILSIVVCGLNWLWFKI